MNQFVGQHLGEAEQTWKSDFLTEKQKRQDSVTKGESKKNCCKILAEPNNLKMTACDLCDRQEAIFKCSKCGKVTLNPGEINF